MNHDGVGEFFQSDLIEMLSRVVWVRGYRSERDELQVVDWTCRFCVFGVERLIRCGSHWNFAPCVCCFENSGLGRPETNIRFINGEGAAERGAVNLRSEAKPWSGLARKGRGSEHGAG